MRRRTLVERVGRERTLVLRHEDEGTVKYELIPLFRPVPPSAGGSRTHDERAGRRP